MQVLFRSSLESPSSKGLGVIPSDIGVFANADKSVPHMGWNSVEFLDPEEKAHEGLDPRASYYFVHSFRAAYDWERPEVAQWAHTTTQYGQEVFLGVSIGLAFAGDSGYQEANAVLRDADIAMWRGSRRYESTAARSKHCTSRMLRNRPSSSMSHR